MELTQEHIALAHRIAQLSEEDKQALLTYLLELQDTEDNAKPPVFSQE